MAKLSIFGVHMGTSRKYTPLYSKGTEWFNLMMIQISVSDPPGSTSIPAPNPLKKALIWIQISVKKVKLNVFVIWEMPFLNFGGNINKHFNLSDMNFFMKNMKNRYSDPDPLRIRIHFFQMWIRGSGSGSTSKWDGTRNAGRQAWRSEGIGWLYRAYITQFVYPRCGDIFSQNWVYVSRKRTLNALT